MALIAAASNGDAGISRSMAATNSSRSSKRQVRLNRRSKPIVDDGVPLNVHGSQSRTNVTRVSASARTDASLSVYRIHDGTCVLTPHPNRYDAQSVGGQELAEGSCAHP